MLVSLSRRYIGQDYASKKPVGEITADMIDLVRKIDRGLGDCFVRTSKKLNHMTIKLPSLFIRCIFYNMSL